MNQDRRASGVRSQTLTPQPPVVDLTDHDDGSASNRPAQEAPVAPSPPAVGLGIYRVPANSPHHQPPAVSPPHASSSGNLHLPAQMPQQVPVDGSLSVLPSIETPFLDEGSEANNGDNEKSNKNGAKDKGNSIEDDEKAPAGYANVDNPTDIIFGGKKVDIDPRFIYYLPPAETQETAAQAPPTEAAVTPATPNAAAAASPAPADPTVPAFSQAPAASFAPASPLDPAVIRAAETLSAPPPFVLPPGVEPDTPASAAAVDAWFHANYWFDPQLGQIAPRAHALPTPAQEAWWHANFWFDRQTFQTIPRTHTSPGPLPPRPHALPGPPPTKTPPAPAPPTTPPPKKDPNRNPTPPERSPSPWTQFMRPLDEVYAEIEAKEAAEDERLMNNIFDFPALPDTPGMEWYVEQTRKRGELETDQVAKEYMEDLEKKKRAKGEAGGKEEDGGKEEEDEEKNGDEGKGEDGEKQEE
ncbi:MAG: hypothetical protein Q9183_006756 [Haloplaca sp. 2 TL-2023]